MNTIRKTMAKRFQLSIAQIFISICVLTVVSASVVTITLWHFKILDRAQTKIKRWSSYSVVVNHLPGTLPTIPDIDETVLNVLAVRSRLPIENDLLIDKAEDRNYLQSILDTIFPDGTAGLSEEEISVEILRYISSALYLKSNTGNASKILHEGYAECGGLSVSFQALVRLTGIPARKVGLYGVDWQGAHSLVEVYYDGQWHLYDPSFGMFLYSKPEYNETGRIASLDDLVTSSASGWYFFKVVEQPWAGYDESVRSFGIVRAEKDYLDEVYGYAFLDQYRQMFTTVFPVAYDDNQIISFPVIADLTDDGKFSVGVVDQSSSDIIDATAAQETAGKTGTYLLLGENCCQYVHTWFIKAPSPGFVRVTYYSTGNLSPVLMLFPLKGIYIVSASQDEKKAEFLLRVSDSESAVQFWSSNGSFWVDAIQSEWLGESINISQ